MGDKFVGLVDQLGVAALLDVVMIYNYVPQTSGD